MSAIVTHRCYHPRTTIYRIRPGISQISILIYKVRLVVVVGWESPLVVAGLVHWAGFSVVTRRKSKSISLLDIKYISLKH